MQSLQGVRFCVDGDVGSYFDLKASDLRRGLLGRTRGRRKLCMVPCHSFYIIYGTWRRKEVGGKFYFHYMWMASDKGGGNSYGGS